MEWTREQRYRNYDSMTQEEEQALNAAVAASKWRQVYHIQPPYGLLNDPNGFVFFNGTYYLFYQWFPFGPVHGMKNWYQTSSTDLVNWRNDGAALKPELPHERHGIFSGSGLVNDEELYLFYTGNYRDEDWNRTPSQCLAIMNKSGDITKRQTPLIPNQPEGYTEHFRDPKVWQSNGFFYMIVGAQRNNLTGCILFYQSNDLTKWNLIGELGADMINFGYMWECPDYFEMDGSGILLFSPQGIQPDGDSYQNLYQSGTFIGNPLHLENGRFEHGDFQELDAGFDFYAPQTTTAEDGRRLLVGWMGLPEIDYPTDQDNWAHCLTIPRQLSVKNNQLYQQPIAELKKKRTNKRSENASAENGLVTMATIGGSSYEMIASIDVSSATKAGLKLRVGTEEETVLYLDVLHQKVVLDRTKSGASFAEEYGTTRQKNYKKKQIDFHIFMDTSSIEVFVNEGEVVFTARIFPHEKSTGTSFFVEDGTANVKAVQWEYQNS